MNPGQTNVQRLHLPRAAHKQEDAVHGNVSVSSQFWYLTNQPQCSTKHSQSTHVMCGKAVFLRFCHDLASMQHLSGLH